MLPARDIYTAAQILTKCFGDDAKLKAVKYAYKLLNEGKLDCVAWMRIVGAIEELQRRERAPDEPVH